MQHHQVFAWTLVVTLAAAHCAKAGTTGKLSGTVTDEQGTPLAGATVTADSPSVLGEAVSTATGAGGAFQFPALRPGLYAVRVELQGFAVQEVADIPVRLDNTTQLNFKMPLGQIATGIEVVSAPPLIDATQVSVAESFPIDYLEDAAVGAANRSYQRILLHAAGVSGPDLDAFNPQGVNGRMEGDNPNVFGSTTAENAYFVDGIETTDPVTGGFGNNFNYDAIREISFIQGGYEAEYGLASAGLVNLITKSGGDLVTGTLDLRWSPDSWIENGDFFDTRQGAGLESTTTSLTLGGPAVIDRLWYFLSVEAEDSELRTAGQADGREFDGQNFIAKLTWDLGPGWELLVKAFTDPAEIDLPRGSTTAPAARERIDQQAVISQANVSGFLTSDLFWDLGIGVQRQDLDEVPASGDLDAAGALDFAGGTVLRRGNIQNALFSVRQRDQLKTSGLLLVDDLAGFHEVKAGLDVSERSLDNRQVPTGRNNSVAPGVGFFFIDIDGEAAGLSRTASQGAIRSEGRFTSAYVQDAWTLASTLTLKLGLRWDEAAYDNDLGDEVATLDRLQPRLGLAWDVGGDGRTVVRFSWGRFMHPAMLALPDLLAARARGTQENFVSCSFVGLSRQRCQTFADSRGREFIDDPFARDPSGWLFSPPAPAFIPTRVVDDLGATTSEMAHVAIERELRSGTSLEVAWIDRDTDDIFEDTCLGNLEGPIAGAACDATVVAQLDELERRYEGLLVTLRARVKHRLNVLASYTYAESQGSVESTQFQGGDFDVFPQNFNRRFGFLADDRRHRVKLNGYATLPRDLALSVNGFWSSDYRWTPVRATELGLEFLEPRGSRKGDASYQLDFQVNKGFELGAVRLELVASVFNVFGTEQVVDLCPFERGCASADFQAATGHQLPRRFQVGLRLEL